MPRVFVDFMGGVLSADAAATGTTISSGALAALPEITGDDWVDITIDPDGLLGSPEPTRITAHTATATTATVDGLLGDYRAGTPWVATLSKEALEGGLGGGGGGGGDANTFRIAMDTDPQEILDTADYFAVNNDAHTAMSAAIADAVALGIQDVVLVLCSPHGYYELMDTVTVSSSVASLTIRGEHYPEASYYNTESGPYIDMGGTGTMFKMTGYGQTIEFDHIEVGGNWGAAFTGYAEVVEFADAATSFGTVVFNDCNIYQYSPGYAPLVAGRVDLIMNRSSLYGYLNTTPAIDIANNFPLGYIRDCLLESDHWSGGALDTSVPLVRFDSISRAGHSASPEDDWSSYRIENNHLECSDSVALSIQGYSSNFRITGNHVEGSPAGSPGSTTPEFSVLLDDVNSVWFSDNQVNHTGIQATGCRDLHIKDNVFRGPQGGMVHLVDTNDSHVSGNTLIDAAATALPIEISGTSSDNMVTRNMIRARTVNPAAAIQITDATCETNVVQGNSLGRTFDTDTPLTFVDNGTGTIT